MSALAAEIDIKLDAVLPDELVGCIAQLLNKFIASFGKVNSSCLVANDTFAIALVDYPIADYIQSQTLASFVKEKCKPLMIDGGIKFPVLCTTTSSLPLYIKADGTSSEPVKQLVHGIMFSFLSSVHVSKIKLSVIDCENHGNSVAPYFDARKKMPGLFDGQFYTTYDSAAAKIRSLNEEVERISQDVLGTQFASVFG